MKLYRKPETEFDAKAQKSVMFAGIVICFGILGALAVLAYELLSDGHIAGGIAAALPACFALIFGVQFIIARAMYCRDLRQIQSEARKKVEESKSEDAE